MKFDSKIMNCPNCGNPITKKAFTFQGVRICETCSKIVQRAVAKAEEELNCIRRMYSEVLRVSILKGELRLPPYPVPKNVTKKEMMGELQKMAERLGGAYARRDPNEAQRGTEGEGKVHPLRDDPQDHGSVSPGNGSNSIPWRR